VLEKLTHRFNATGETSHKVNSVAIKMLTARTATLQQYWVTTLEKQKKHNIPKGTPIKPYEQFRKYASNPGGAAVLWHGRVRLLVSAVLSTERTKLPEEPSPKRFKPQTSDTTAATTTEEKTPNNKNHRKKAKNAEITKTNKKKHPLNTSHEPARQEPPLHN